MFQWNDFLTLAESLAASRDEAALRSAISRAYYASFHSAQDLCRDLRIPIPREIQHSGRNDTSVHARMIAALKHHPSRRLNHAGKLVASIRKLRNDADYALPFDGNLVEAAQQAIIDAHSVIDDLNNYYRGT